MARQRRAIRAGRRLWRGDRGAEVTELAIVLGLIVAGAIATIALLGPLVEGLYDTMGKALTN